MRSQGELCFIGWLKLLMIMLTSLLFSGSMEVFLDTIQFIGFGFDFFWLVFVLLLLESVLIGFEPVTLDVQNNVDGRIDIALKIVSVTLEDDVCFLTMV